jgi:AraC-like DNA-binding protein
MPVLPADIYEKLVKAKMFMDEHFDGTIDLDKVSSCAYLSAFHFHRLFTKVYRITPHQYITKKRLAKAKELLRSGEVSIAGVCTDVGFESHGSFTVLFKKHNGSTPKIFRDKAQEKQQKAVTQPALYIPHCFMSPQTDEAK